MEIVSPPRVRKGGSAPRQRRLRNRRPRHLNHADIVLLARLPRLAREFRRRRASIQRLKTSGLVKGHDFSRADKANQIKRALAPAKAGTQEISPVETFSAASFAPANIDPNAKPDNDRYF